MKIVISIGGSLLTKEISCRNFKNYAKIIQKISNNNKIIVVCGGGSIARQYIKIAKICKCKRENQDFIGIMATHLNASTLYSLLKNAYLIKWKPLKEAEKEVKKYFGKKILVAAGYDTKHSTDYNAAYFASIVNADIVINVTNVDGVYDKDPSKYKNARKFEFLSYDDFIKIVSKLKQSPGEYRLFDIDAAKILKKYKIPLKIIDGRNPKNIEKALKENIGTLIK
ncbi:MAG: UMP kinase [Candidatus Aenigmatarchaeota archaeon]